jgi:hypothetical protein
LPSRNFVHCAPKFVRIDQECHDNAFRLSDSERLEVETMGAADPRRHAFEAGAVMAAVADQLLAQMAHLVG